jgi:hypothetical protein
MKTTRRSHTATRLFFASPLAMTALPATRGGVARATGPEPQVFDGQYTRFAFDRRVALTARATY